jgi:hypothetical protein
MATPSSPPNAIISVLLLLRTPELSDRPFSSGGIQVSTVAAASSGLFARANGSQNSTSTGEDSLNLESTRTAIALGDRRTPARNSELRSMPCASINSPHPEHPRLIHPGVACPGYRIWRLAAGNRARSILFVLVANAALSYRGIRSPTENTVSENLMPPVPNRRLGAVRMSA